MVIEVNKDIDRYKESVVLGLTARQLIYSIVSVPLDGNERLKVLHDFYHLGEEDSFDFDIKHAAKVGADFKNEDVFAM